MDKYITPGISLRIDNDKDTKKAIGILKEQYLIANKKQFPSLPEYARSVPAFTDKTANGLTKCIIQFIRLTGGQAERINCTGRIIDKRQTVTNVLGQSRSIGRIQYIKSTGVCGTADVSATIQGRSVKIEVKIGADRQSEAQKEYQHSIEASGGLYFIAKSFEQFYTWYCLKFRGRNYGK